MRVGWGDQVLFWEWTREGGYWTVFKYWLKKLFPPGFECGPIEKNLRIPPSHRTRGFWMEEAWNEKKTNKTYWKVVQNMIFKRWLLTKIRYENSESNSKQMNNAKSTWKWNMWGANCQGMMKRIQACLRLCYLLWKLLEYESAESVNFVNVL